MTENIVFKRFIAYCIDLFIISILITLLSQVNFLNPKRNEYKKAITSYNTYSEKMQEKIKKVDKVDKDILLNDEYVKIIYNIDYYGVSYTIIEFVVFICYFTLLPFFRNGQTFGKELMKISVVNKDDSNVKIGKLFLRSLLLPIYTNIFLYTSLKSAILAVVVFFIKPWSYFYLNGILSIILTLYCYVDIIVLFVNKEKLAIHDLLLKTKVVSYVRTK